MRVKQFIIDNIMMENNFPIISHLCQSHVPQYRFHPRLVRYSMQMLPVEHSTGPRGLFQFDRNPTTRRGDQKGQSKVKRQVACEETSTLHKPEQKSIKPGNVKTLIPINYHDHTYFSLLHSNTHRINALFPQQNQIDVRFFFHHAL